MSLKPFLQRTVKFWHRSPEVYDGVVQSPISISAIPENSCLAFTLTETKNMVFEISGLKNSVPVTENVIFSGELENRGFQLFDSVSSITVTGNLGGNVTIVPLRESGIPIFGYQDLGDILVDSTIDQDRITIENPGQGKIIARGFKYFCYPDAIIFEGDVFEDEGIKFKVESVRKVKGFPDFMSHIEIGCKRELFTT